MTQELSVPLHLANNGVKMSHTVDTEVKYLNTIALRGIVIFPGSTASFEIGRKASINALKNAEANDEPIFLVPQIDASIIKPLELDLLSTGVIARVVHTARLQDGAIQVVVEGIRRAERENTIITDDLIKCSVKVKERRKISSFVQERVAVKELYEVFSEYLNYIAKPSEEIIEEVNNITDASQVADFLASNFVVNFDERIQLLEEYDTTKRIKKLTEIFQKDIEIFNVDNKIHQKVRYTLQKQQKDIYLREQIRAIKNELGDESADDMEDGDELYSKIKNAKIPKDIQEKLLSENAKLSKMPFGTPEATVIRNYIEVCLELPWDKKTKDRIDIDAAKRILDKVTVQTHHQVYRRFALDHCPRHDLLTIHHLFQDIIGSHVLNIDKSTESQPPGKEFGLGLAHGQTDQIRHSHDLSYIRIDCKSDALALLHMAARSRALSVHGSLLHPLEEHRIRNIHPQFTLLCQEFGLRNSKIGEIRHDKFLSMPCEQIQKRFCSEHKDQSDDRHDTQMLQDGQQWIIICFFRHSPY